MMNRTIDSHSENPTVANLWATRDQLRAWGNRQPEPMQDLASVTCSLLRTMAENPRLIEDFKGLLAGLLERLRNGEGMGRSQS